MLDLNDMAGKSQVLRNRGISESVFSVILKAKESSSRSIIGQRRHRFLGLNLEVSNPGVSLQGMGQHMQSRVPLLSILF